MARSSGWTADISSTLSMAAGMTWPTPASSRWRSSATCWRRTSSCSRSARGRTSSRRRRMPIRVRAASSPAWAATCAMRTIRCRASTNSSRRASTACSRNVQKGAPVVRFNWFVIGNFEPPVSARLARGECLRVGADCAVAARGSSPGGRPPVAQGRAADLPETAGNRRAGLRHPHLFGPAVVDFGRSRKP